MSALHYGLHPYLLRPVVLTDIQTVGLNYFSFFQRKIAIYCELLGYFVGNFFSSFCFVETALYELFWESKVWKCIKLLIIYQYIKSTKTHFLGSVCQCQHQLWRPSEHLPNPFHHPTLTVVLLTCRILSIRTGKRTGSSTGQKPRFIVAVKCWTWQSWRSFQTLIILWFYKITRTFLGLYFYRAPYTYILYVF